MKRWHWFVLCLVCLSLGAVMLLPMVDKRWAESFFGAEEETVSIIGDEPFNSTDYLGYELLENNSILHMWNTQNDYYFNVSNGIQFSNHYNEYWTHNVMMLGYYDGDEWNLIYRTDELSGFNRNLSGETDDYLNATLWKDLSYGAYDFRLAIRYHLGVNDSNLTIIPYMKNTGIDIPFDIGFGWKITNWDIPSNETDDILVINNTGYNTKGVYDLTFKNLNETFFKGRDTTYAFGGEFLRVDWNEDLNYVVKMFGNGIQEDFYVALLINVGHFNPQQEKSTTFQWIDALVKGTNCGFVTVAPTVDPEGIYSLIIDSNAIAFKDTSPVGTVKITEIGWWCRVATEAANFEVGIYSHDAGNDKPDARTFRDSTNAKGTTTGWKTVAVDWTIDAETIYWIAVQLDDTATATSTQRITSAGERVDIKLLETYLTSPWGTTDTAKGYICAFYALVEIEAPPNTAPTQSGEVPVNVSTGIGLNPRLVINASDADGDWMNATFRTNNTGSWGDIGTNTTHGSHWVNQTNSSFDSYSTKYWWSVNISDGTDWTNETYHFTTESAASWQSIPSMQLNYSISAPGSWNDQSFLQLNYSISNTALWINQPWLQFNYSISNTALWNNQPFLQLNYSISNTANYNTIPSMQLNYSISNTSIKQWNNIPSMQLNYSISAPGSWNDQLSLQLNYSISNSAFWLNIPTLHLNYSISNSAFWLKQSQLQLNYSISNSAFWLGIPALQLNYSISNTAQYNNIPSMQLNYSISNSSTPVAWQSIPSMQLNYSISAPGSWNDQSFLQLNYSISNSSAPMVWQSISSMQLNYSFSNSSVPLFTITSEYPTNNSNILVVQPTVYFNLTHPSGGIMNYTIYIGNTSSTCNTFLYSKGNVGTGLQSNSSHQYYTVVNYTRYYWRVMANDGSTWINETYNFNYTGSGGGTRSGSGVAIALASGAMMFAVIVFGMKVMEKRRRRG